MALRVRSEAEIAKAFKDLTSATGTGLIVPPEPFTSAHRRQIVDLAAQHGLPATYGLRDFVVDGGLMCYGMPAFAPLSGLATADELIE